MHSICQIQSLVLIKLGQMKFCQNLGSDNMCEFEVGDFRSECRSPGLFQRGKNRNVFSLILIEIVQSVSLHNI